MSAFNRVAPPNQFVPTAATNTDYTLSVDYRWTSTFMTYLKYATGFKGGGFSPRPANPLQTVPFAPEKLKTAELGAKSEPFGRTMRLNGAVFYSKYTNQQTFAQQFDSSGANWFREMNAGKSSIWGLEAELQVEPVDKLRIDASVGYIDYTLDDNEGNALLFEGDDCGGSRCYSPRTPKLNGAVGVQRGFDAAGGTLTPRVDVQYTSKIYFVTNNGCFAPYSVAGSTAGCGNGAQDAYTIANARLTWKSGDQQWELAAYVNNLTDETYFNGKLSLITFFGREQGNPGAPRTYGFVFKRSF